MNESQIISYETALRAWFTRHADPILAEIDGLDIGWGGVQRWATSLMPAPDRGLHLDFACGYGTFLAQLGFRFPDVRLIGLNISFTGPHALVSALLAQADVDVSLVQANALRMPFPESAFSSVSCFLGLQDIEIGFGPAGVQAAITEAVRALKWKGILILLDEYSFERFENIVKDLPIIVITRAERALDVRWDRKVAERAIEVYSEGWVAQARLNYADERQRLYEDVFARMKAEMEDQLSKQGYYVPFGPVRLMILQKVKV